MSVCKEFNLEDLIDSHDTQSNSYLTNCPFCNKKKLYIKKDLSCGYCHKCSISFFPPKIEWRRSNQDAVEFDPTLVFLSKKLSLENDTPGLRYFKARFQYENPYELDIREVDGGLVIPFHYKNELIYYQVRSIDDSLGWRYYSPPTNHKPIYSLIKNPMKPVIVVEGVFDAMALYFCGYNSIAVLGKTASDFQKKLILNLKLSNGFIFLDDKNLSINLSKSFRKNKIDFKIIDPKGIDLDPSDLYTQQPDLLKNILRESGVQ